MIKAAVEAALNAEMADHLGYDRHEAQGRGSGNSRNGLTAKTVQTTAGSVGLEVPRDRNGTFDPVSVPKGVRRLHGFDDMILSLFAKGMATRDIAEHLEATYGASVSHETISEHHRCDQRGRQGMAGSALGRGVPDHVHRCDPFADQGRWRGPDQGLPHRDRRLKGW